MKIFAPTKPCGTREGSPVRILVGVKRIIGFIGESEDFSIWNPDGSYCLDKVSRYDLINIPEKYEIELCLYRSSYDNKVYVSVANSPNGIIAKKTITFEEGEGL